MGAGAGNRRARGGVNGNTTHAGAGVELPLIGTALPFASDAPEHPVGGRWPEQPRGPDLLSLPLLRRFLRWRYARLVFQLPLLLLVIVLLIDGFTGRQLAPRNVATTAVWLEYRGLAVIALALFGNLFCSACPLMLTRGPSRILRRLLPASLRFSWPRWLRSKYLVVVVILLYLFSYEYFDLWASPWLTAWVVLGYFGAALAVDVFFPPGTFCRYVCPLGNFNYTLATTSPTQIVAVDRSVCDRCEHKPCLHGRETHADAAMAGGQAAFVPLAEVTNPNGTGFFPGCETGLFAPAMTSSMDCTSCFNCVRACPYDNVGIRLRSPAREAATDAWARRGRMSVMILGVVLAAAGLLNAAAMVAPWYEFVDALAAALGTRNEALLLGLLTAGTALLGLAVTVAAGAVADLAGGRFEGFRASFMRWGYVVVVLGIGFWFSHFLFHFLTGALQIVPTLQNFLQLRGLNVTPDWSLAQLVPSRWLFTITAAVTSIWTFIAAYAAIRIALRDFGRRGVLAMWPQLLFVLAFAALAVWLLGQPMEMRGTLLLTLPE